VNPPTLQKNNIFYLIARSEASLPHAKAGEKDKNIYLILTKKRGFLKKL
jgi:hypothetical protein